MTTDYKYAEGTDRLLSYGDESFEYDGMGNPTTYRDMACRWEKGRQLKQISDGTNTVSFTYDVFGVRTSKNVNGTTTHYVYENGKLLRQKTDNDTIDFIYGRDGVIGFTLNNVPYLYRKNLFGDVVEIYNQRGDVVGKYSYTAFGECDVVLDTGSIATKNPIRYRSYYFDEELNLYYLKTRYYDPAVGRFITIDDLSYLDPESINGLNLYAYCGNDPVMRVDENGNAWWDWLLGAVSLIAGIALCFVPGGQVFGAGLIVNGACSLVSCSLDAAGVDSKITSIITSGLSIISGIVLCCTGLGSLGAGMIGQGIGGIAGGFISEACGGSFTTGAAIGGIVGSIVGGFAYRGVQNYRLSKMTPYQKGVMGEKYVQRVTGIKAHTENTGHLRPDFVSDKRGILIDAKNVAKQGLTNQLRSYQGMGYNKTVIYVRLHTKISSALRNSGIIIKYFPW